MIIKFEGFLNQKSSDLNELTTSGVMTILRNIHLPEGTMLVLISSKRAFSLALSCIFFFHLQNEIMNYFLNLKISKRFFFYFSEFSSRSRLFSSACKSLSCTLRLTVFWKLSTVKSLKRTWDMSWLQRQVKMLNFSSTQITNKWMKFLFEKSLTLN